MLRWLLECCRCVLHAAIPLHASPGEIVVTTTFKHKKGDAVSEGCNPSTITDPIFFRDDSQKKFDALTPELYQQIAAGKVRV